MTAAAARQARRRARLREGRIGFRSRLTRSLVETLIQAGLLDPERGDDKGATRRLPRVS